MKEKAWITIVDGEEMCVETEVSWTREQEEKRRKDKRGFIPYCENSELSKCGIPWRKKCFKNCQDFLLNNEKYNETFDIINRGDSDV